MNVDRQARLRFAEVTRHFAAGRLTNDEYEDAVDRLLDSRDPSLWAIWWSVWFCYDDIRTHRLAGQWALTPEAKRAVARAIVFLHSDTIYEWPRTRWWRVLLGLFTLGIWPRLFPAGATGGDEEVWPFFRRSDFDAATAKPRLLSGAN